MARIIKFFKDLGLGPGNKYAEIAQILALVFSVFCIVMVVLRFMASGELDLTGLAAVIGAIGGLLGAGAARNYTRTKMRDDDLGEPGE